MNLAIINHVKDFKLFSSNEKKIYLPLNISTMLYCIVNNLKYVDPSDYFKNIDHYKGQKFSNKISKDTNIKTKKFKFLNKEYKHKIIYFLNLYFFFKQLLMNILKKKKFKNLIIIDNKSKKITLSFKIKSFKSLFDQFFLKTIFSKEKKFIYYNYSLNIKKKERKKFDFIFFQTGYNFRRIIIGFVKKRKKISIITLEKISFIKKFIFKILNIKIFYIIKTLSRSPKQDIDFSFPDKIDKNLKKLIIFRNKIIEKKIIDLYKKKKIFDDFFKLIKSNFIISHNTVGDSLPFLTSAYENNVSILNLPHGTINLRNKANENDYNKLIANNLLFEKAKYNLIQTPVSNTNNFYKKIEDIQLGNIIFEEIRRNNNKNILYAVTSKNLDNMHFVGQELYFEYIKNLKILDKIAQKKNFNIIVKPHPNYMKFLNLFKKTFNNLKFKNLPISSLLKNTEITISFSSTAIEDSLASKIPVILFDPHKRYNHLSKLSNKEHKNWPIKYVTNEFSLCKLIYQFKKKKFNYDNFLFSKNYSESLNNLEKKLI